ncbi:MAG: hypothetical protein AAF216_10635 [Pseudomonadota bacterium]
MADDILMLPAVWSTTELERRVSDIALAGGGASTLAVAYEGRGVELFNFDAERIAPIAPIAVNAISDGAFVDFGDAALTLFPAISEDAKLVGIVYGEGLVGPQQIDLPIETGGDVIGLCSRRTVFEEDGVLVLAYWTATNWENLNHGVLSVNGDSFVWTPSEPTPRDGGGCTLPGNGDVIVSPAGTDAVVVDRPDQTYVVSLSDDGALTARTFGGEDEVLGIRDGITVRAPVRPTAIAALGIPLGGGYPDGLIVLSGADGYRDKVVFVDAGGLSALAE